MANKFCHACGTEIHESATSCPKCGAAQRTQGTVISVGGTGKAVLAVVCWFLGPLGVHRMISGKVGTGILQLVLTCTVAGLFITVPWAIIDFIMILTNNWEDKDGAKVTNW